MRSISSSTNALRFLREDRALGAKSNVAWVMLTSAALLSFIGAATIRSASLEMGVDYLPRQAVWIALGLLAFIAGMLIDYHWLLRVSPQLYGLGLLAVLMVSLFGHEAGGARSWVGLAGLGGQPSDFMKLATVLLMGRYFSTIRSPLLRHREILVACGIVALPMGLIALQPDLGGAMMFVPILIGMVVVSGVRMRTVVITAVVLAIIGAGLWMFGMREYQRDRILSFVSQESDPLGAGYQLRQSKIAVGSGQLLGRGYQQGTQSQLRFLPARHTDFIFAVLAEERGFLGVVAVLGLYGLFLWSGVRAACRSRDRSGILVVCGLLSVLGAYVIYNTGMMIGLVPITGIPLPFLSYGGSFTLFCFFATGIIAGVDLRRYVNR